MLEEKLQVQEKVDMTYAQVEEQLFHYEGLFGKRIIEEGSTFVFQKLEDGKWRKFASYGKRRFVLRQVFKELREEKRFVDGCEMYKNKQFVGEYQKNYQVSLRQRERERKEADDKFKLLLSSNFFLDEEDRKEYINEFKSALMARATAYEGDGYIKGIEKPRNTIECFYRGKKYFLAQADDGVSGPTIVNEESPKEWQHLDGDVEELNVLQQLITNPWIKAPFEF